MTTLKTGEQSVLQNILLIAIVLVNFYVIFVPLLPAALFIATSKTSSQQHLQAAIHRGDAHDKPSSTDRPNSLTVPAMLLDEPVYSGADRYAELNKGIWHEYTSSTPDKGGNTVLLGHRFTYTNPTGVFYHLDKLKIGDEIGLQWDEKQYIYKVSEVKVVHPTDTYIEDQTNDARLTLYTCTPLIWPKDRLVIVAQLEGI